MQSISAIALALGILAGSQSDASDTATSSARMCPTTTSAWQFEPEWSARNIEAASATLSPDVLTVVPSRDELLRQQVGMRDRLTRRSAVAGALERADAEVSLKVPKMQKATLDSQSGPYQVGSVVALERRATFHTPDWVETTAGPVSTFKVRVDGATAIRLNLRASLTLSAYAIGSAGTIFGPFTIDSGLRWTDLAVGEEYSLVIFASDNPTAKDESFEITVAAVEMLDERFEPARHLAAQFQTGVKTYCNDSRVLPCMVNASCYSNADFPAFTAARQATASLHFVSGSQAYVCTGTLLNDADPDSVVPYLLTANHCINTQVVASTLELYWDFSTPCNSSSCVSSTILYQNGGADLLSTGARPGLPDYTLLRLHSTPPAGSGRSYLPVHSGTVGEVFVYRISHPFGLPQSYTRSIIRGSDWIGSGACSALPYPGFLYSTLNIGATQGGSSGSAQMLPTGAIIGQLYGNCARGNTCSQDWDVDGQMYFTYPRISPFLQQIDLISRRGFE